MVANQPRRERGEQAGTDRPELLRLAGKLKKMLVKTLQRVDQVRVAFPAPTAGETDAGETPGLDFFRLRIDGGR
jgi:hypothetical protein